MKRLIVFCCVLMSLSVACGDPPKEDPKENNQNNNNTTNTPPVAEAGDNQIVQVGEVVTVNASESSDADGDVLTVKWTLDAPDGSSTMLESDDKFRINFTPDLAGDYILTLTVSDGTVEASDRVTVRAQGTIQENTKPVANVGQDVTLPLGGSIALDGSNSSDADGDTLTYRWSVTDAPAGSVAPLANATSAKTEFTPDVAGSYSIELVVNDGKVDSDPAILSLTILPETNNTAPVADAGPDQMGIAVNMDVTLDGSNSNDAENDTLTYKWSIKQTPQGSTVMLSDDAVAQPTFKPDLTGVYIFELVVNDGELDSVADEVSVTVPGQNTGAPVANPGQSFTTRLNQMVTLDGSRSTDPDNDPLTFRWVLASKPAGSFAFMMNANTAMPTLTPDRLGDYVIELTVNDGTNDSLPVSLTMKVVDGPTTCLIISEYIEGSSLNKALELYNCGGTMLDMTQIGVCLVRNAATTCSETTMLSGLLNGMSTYGICHDSINMGLTNGACTFLNTNVMSFSGDDRLIVFQDIDNDQTFSGQDFVLDAFGQSAVEPSGNEWKDVTYRRCNFTPYDGSTAFDASILYNSANRDDFGGFGQPPVMGCSPQNQAPTAVITGPTTGTVAQSLSFNATQSTDPENDALTFTWNLTVIPNGSNAVLGATTGDTTSFVPDLEGDYTLTLTANDGTQNSPVVDVVVNATSGPMPSACLIISEYIEGSSSNKALEIYNCGQSPVDLTKFGICIAANGDASCGNGAALTGMLAADSVIGVCHPSIDTNLPNTNNCTISSMVATNFNGNDRVAIFEDVDGTGTYTQGDIIVDAFGNLSQAVSNNEWEDVTYNRCSFARYIGAGMFDPLSYYTKAVGVDNFSDFGTKPASTCNAMNQAPVANAGPDQNIAMNGSAVTLDGTSSFDPDNDPITYQWVLVQKPAMSMSTLMSPTMATPMFVPDVDGVYVLELIVEDGMTMSTPDQVSIIVGTQPMPSECLIISEYIEGSSSNKALELYNCGSNALDLSNYGVCLISNGGTSCMTTDKLSGMLATDDVHGICGGSLNLSLVDNGDCKETLPVINYNGNDRLIIFKDDNNNNSYDAGSDTIMDAFGQSDTDPGNIWANQTLRRCNRTTYDGLSMFNAMTYYTQHATDDFSDFGDKPTALTCP